MLSLSLSLLHGNSGIDVPGQEGLESWMSCLKLTVEYPLEMRYDTSDATPFPWKISKVGVIHRLVSR
jgi:hypothetical protein